MEKMLTGWEDAEIIHAYSRREALEDGVLVDLGQLARDDVPHYCLY